MRILDLGSGPTVKFAKELEAAGVKASVSSLSPDYLAEEHRDRAKESYSNGLVAGVGEALPFKDEAFDKVVALFTHIHVKDPDLCKHSTALAYGSSVSLYHERYLKRKPSTPWHDMMHQQGAM